MNMIPHAITSLLSMVFHIFKANAYLVSSVYENKWNTLQLLRLHFLAFEELLFWNLLNLCTNWIQLMSDIVKGFENVEIRKNWICPWLPWIFKWKRTEEHFWVGLRQCIYFHSVYCKLLFIISLWILNSHWNYLS